MNSQQYLFQQLSHKLKIIMNLIILYFLIILLKLEWFYALKSEGKTDNQVEFDRMKMKS
jgi:hypothetical protein